MKETKFKAWHKAEKVMCDVSLINFDQGAFLIGVKKGEDEIGDKYFVPAPTDGRFCSFDEFELLEYTGMKDKNGKKSYHNNLVKCNGKASGQSGAPRDMIGVIDWHLHGWEIAVWYENEWWWPGSMNYSTFEIIGNIYENPELLTLTK